ncbi:hypothetical protein Tco_0321227 [Tanacetum coccineum]
MVMEGLHIALKYGLVANMFSGVKVGSNGIHVSHLFYVDDVIIFSDWNQNDIDNIIWILNVFYIASGLKINVYKSNLYGVGVSSSEIEHFDFRHGMRMAASFDKGGLGVGSLKDFNISMLLKWRWHHLSSLSSLWVKVVKSIHGDEKGIDLRGCQTNGLWASIVGTINHLHSNGILPLKSIRFNVGDDSLICFWKDTWLGDLPLYIRYNRLYRLERDKKCLIRDHIINGCWSWDWYKSVLQEDLLEEIGSLEMVDGGDCCLRTLSQDGTYSVSNMRKHIDDVMLPNNLPCKRSFKVIPKNINIFMWRTWNLMPMSSFLATQT